MFSFVIPDSCFDEAAAAVIRTVVQLLSMRRPADVSSDTSLPRFMSANNSPECAYFAVLVATPHGASRQQSARRNLAVRLYLATYKHNRNEFSLVTTFIQEARYLSVHNNQNTGQTTEESRFESKEEEETFVICTASRLTLEPEQPPACESTRGSLFENKTVWI